MDAITTIFVLSLFGIAIFLTLIVRHDWLAREDLERLRRRNLYASHVNARPRPPARGVRPAGNMPGRVGRQHFDLRNAGRDEANGEARVTEGRSQAEG
jgi:hypothetical protein